MYYTFFLNEKNPNLMKTQPLTERTDYEQQVQSTIHTKRSQNNKLFTEQSELFNKTITAKPQIISKLKRKGIFPKKLIKSVSYPPQQQKTSQHKIMIQVVEQSFQSEILKITDDNRIKQQNPKMQIIEMIVVNKLLIDQTLQMIQKALAQKHRRNEVVAMIHDIGYLMLKLRNQDLKIITYLILAKISKYYKLNLLAINLAKFAKRFSDQEQYIKYKMYAYKILGQCMIGFKQDQAKIYITKYLMCSWKQNCKNDELKAYDLLGRYYYYEGNIQSAIIYHSKMADGETVNDESNLKRLGVAKLQQGSIGKSKKDKYFSLEEPDYQVSSDDEPFEIIFNAEDSQDLQNAKKNIENILKNVKRKSLLGYNLRKVANFDKNNEKRSQFEYKNANQFIRQPKPSPRISLVTPEGFLDLSKIKGLSRANVHLGNLKDHVLINHKSPNRCLVNYQFLELNKQTNSIKSQEFLEPLYEANDINKITKGFHKLSIILHNVREWLSDKMSYYEQM